MWQKLSCEQICLCPQYSKSHKTGSGHAADSKLPYTIQFSILMLYAKYQVAGLCGSREKCDRNFLWRRRRRKTTDCNPYMSPLLMRAGDTISIVLSPSAKKNSMAEPYRKHFSFNHTYLSFSLDKLICALVCVEWSKKNSRMLSISVISDTASTPVAGRGPVSYGKHNVIVSFIISSKFRMCSGEVVIWYVCPLLATCLARAISSPSETDELS